MKLKFAAIGMAFFPLVAFAASGVQFSSSHKVGQDTYINKYVDFNEGVVCYVLKPSDLHYSQDTQGNRAYDANSVGSISCVKVSK